MEEREEEWMRWSKWEDGEVNKVWERNGEFREKRNVKERRGGRKRSAQTENKNCGPQREEREEEEENDAE